eukprot:CAMPEP_0203962724 /NCGR_PEP_ID=MMETSP0359-20131031/92840_1 /ASSEMBLY_ACC=CAM_ASM_000338 /TAXON_ID=268821 /ORGANISM="Scrippsiella Hangoei, Strain SHTV-5" /LENGTH=50 /DNA_ID=CAMNT_0050898177 /DNA_START=105 /DNA_END=255 /DNA_ORIENTATION=-
MKSSPLQGPAYAAETLAHAARRKAYQTPSQGHAEQWGSGLQAVGLDPGHL